MRRSRSGGRRPCRRAAPATRPADDIGALDAGAIARVRDEARPDPRDADELHDALLTAGFLTRDERDARRAIRRTARRGAGRGARRRASASSDRLWVAAERLPELLAVHPDAACEPADRVARRRAPSARWTRETRSSRLCAAA